MSVLSDIWEKVTGTVRKIPEGLAGLGSSIAGYYDTRNRQGNLVDAYRDREQRNYDDAKAEYDYWQNQYLPEYQAYEASQNAAASARASAAAATAENARKASKKGAKAEKRYFEQAMGNVQPWIDTGHRLLPQVEQTYGNALSGMNLLQGYMNTPQYTAKMNTSVPAYKTNIPLPNYIKGNK